MHMYVCVVAYHPKYLTVSSSAASLVSSWMMSSTTTPSLNLAMQRCLNSAMAQRQLAFSFLSPLRPVGGGFACRGRYDHAVLKPGGSGGRALARFAHGEGHHRPQESLSLKLVTHFFFLFLATRFDLIISAQEVKANHATAALSTAQHTVRSS